MMTQEVLWRISVGLFGDNSPVTSMLQNPGMIKTQEDVHCMYQMVKHAVKDKEREFIALRNQSQEFISNVTEFFKSGGFDEQVSNMS